MTVQQVIDLADNGELRSLGMKGKTSTILGFLNLGMLELYKRFTLKVEEHVIELVDDQVIYDMPDGFMWLIAAYGEVAEVSEVNVDVLPVNKEDDPRSINTVGWNKVQIPLVENGAFISIIYAASPVTYSEADLAVAIDLPPQLIDALLAYIGYKAHGAVETTVQTEDNIYYQRFEAACNQVLNKGMINADDMFMDDRITSRGFV